MFTGIIETTGVVQKMEQTDGNISFWIESTLTESLKVDQSLSHNGVCLTIEAINNSRYKVTAIAETLQKTNLGHLNKNSLVNLERSMKMNGRLDGHIVQGHVDCTSKCIDLKEKNGSWEYIFEIDPKFAGLIIEKGSITLNGISLTIFNVTQTSFTVAIIPYTYEHTNIQQIKEESKVNIEFDMIGKYVQRLTQLKR
jgi:riboflavin synthase